MISVEGRVDEPAAVTGNPVTSFRYDTAGNLLDDGLRSYAWDAAGRLVSVTVKPGVTTGGLTPGTYDWAYNAAGQRVSESVNGTLTRRWVWEPGAPAPAAELDATGTVVTKRFYAQGEVRFPAPVSSPASSVSYFYTRDHLGSVREVLDATGATVAAYDYDAYGRRTTLPVAGSIGCDFGYTGHLTHAPTGLVLTLYRAYDPETGRWLSRDPIWENGGVNLYGYVGGSPLMFDDPFGLAQPGMPATSAQNVDSDLLNEFEPAGRNIGNGAAARAQSIADATGAKYDCEKMQRAQRAAEFASKTGAALASIQDSTQTVGGIMVAGTLSVKVSKAGWKLTTAGASKVVNHKTFGTFYKSKSDGLWWVADNAGRGGSAFKVYEGTTCGLKWKADATAAGDFINGKHKGPTGQFIPWNQLNSR